MSLPQHLLDHYQYIQDEVKQFNDAYEQFQIDSLPRYVSVPRYCYENELELTYDEMCDLAGLAANESIKMNKIIRDGKSPIGMLKCFYEGALYSAYEIMIRRGTFDNYLKEYEGLSEGKRSPDEKQYTGNGCTRAVQTIHL